MTIYNGPAIIDGHEDPRRAGHVGVGATVKALRWEDGHGTVLAHGVVIDRELTRTRDRVLVAWADGGETWMQNHPDFIARAEQ